jgi:hypothetical protein
MGHTLEVWGIIAVGLAALAAASPGGALGSQTGFLGLGAEKASVFQLPQNASMLHGSPKAVH